MSFNVNVMLMGCSLATVHLRCKSLIINCICMLLSPWTGGEIGGVPAGVRPTIRGSVRDS